MDWVPVPAPVFGQLLADIDDPNELKILMRTLWHINRKKGAPRPVSVDELSADSLVSDAISLSGDELVTELHRALDSLAARGIFLSVGDRDAATYVINTQDERDAVSRSGIPVRDIVSAAPETWDSPSDRPGIYELYEQNIGALTPLIAERLTEAVEAHPESWLREAITIAVENNARNWGYVTAILERWQTEGREDGEPRRDPEELRQEEFRKAFAKYARRT
jgi:DnaD/phage-associated family protein